MIDFPRDLLTTLPRGAEPVALRWWAGLKDADRDRVAGLWDTRLEVQFFTPQTDEGRTDGWDEVPPVTGGRFVPHDDDGRRDWDRVTLNTYFNILS